MSAKQVCEAYRIDPKRGMERKKALRQLQKDGKNCLIQAKQPGIWHIFFGQFKDFMIAVLFAAAAVSFAAGAAQGHADWTDPIIILTIVLVNACIGTAQEAKASKAIEALSRMTAPMACVRRDGRVQRIAREEVVCGDILILKSGDIVPADARLIEAVGMKVDESSLTGESMPVTKQTESCPPQAPLAERRCMVWANTVVLAGHGEAVAVATGMHTQMGAIAQLLERDDTPQTPLQQRLSATGRVLGIGALAICFVIFLIGLWRGIAPLEMLLTAVSLAVAAIPEGLVAIVSLLLAMGVRTMASRNAIIRKLPAVETLGSTNVICSDKTGTLTLNRMTVTEMAGQEREVLSWACLCSNGTDPTECALAERGARLGITREILEKSYPRLEEIPFDSVRKRMTTVHQNGEGRIMVVKGAPDKLFAMCFADPEMEKAAREMGQRGLRVLAVAVKKLAYGEKAEEKDLTLCGLAGISDPPRPEVPEAIRLCKRAGIRPVMVTGDRADTALAIARSIGLASPTDRVLHGEKLASMSDAQLNAVIGEVAVFARVTPADKVRIVKAFQAGGEVVAMTGDGVNDAPALRMADIGCAMGKNGTDVAKQAADMVLADDHFATIVEAVRFGRGAYRSIRRCVHFLLSSNIGEILTIFTAIAAGWETPLPAVQLLWVNLVTDSLPALALGTDKPDGDIMEAPPAKKGESFFSNGLGAEILAEGIMIGLLSLTAYYIGAFRMGDLTAGRTMCFCVLALSQLTHSFNVRSEKSVIRAQLRNPYPWLAVLLCTALQLAVVSVPALASLFEAGVPNAVQWLWIAGLSLAPLPICEVAKWLSRPFKSKKAPKSKKLSKKRRKTLAKEQQL
ncbi:MAG: cation-translocating P-type ATPase [Clostridia bacterium]|nr:cation-translocating P-type ATPase [Clostridia bacterium]